MSVEVRGKLGESVISFHHAGSRSNLGYQSLSHLTCLTGYFFAMGEKLSSFG